METNIAEFRKLLTELLTLCEEISPSFAEYFKLTYCKHVEQWAVCYRVGTPMNTNMYAESFHRVLKIVYLEHKQNRRIDYLIYILLKIARDKAFEQLQNAHKGKVTQRICDINKRHKTALSFVSLAIIQEVGGNKYKVSSQSWLGITYSIEKIGSNCMCKLKCRYCSACPHIYSCNCLDASTNTTVCKHMHLLQMQQPVNNEQTNKNGNNQLEYYKKVINVTKPGSIATTSSLRYKVERRAYDILALCNRSENTDKLQKVYEYLSSALECLYEEESNIHQKQKPSYQKSSTQPRFYSTNKKKELKYLASPNHLMIK